MIVKGANINAEDNDGKTPLHEAATAYVERGRKEKEVAELLIANGADINARNGDGDTPMQIAINEEHKEIEALLRKHGAR